MIKKGYLKHGSYATATSDHSYILDMSLFHFLSGGITDKELRISFVYNVTTDSCYAHFGSLLCPIYELREETTLRVLEVPQIYFNQEVHIA